MREMSRESIQIVHVDILYNSTYYFYFSYLPKGLVLTRCQYVIESIEHLLNISYYLGTLHLLSA